LAVINAVLVAVVPLRSKPAGNVPVDDKVTFPAVVIPAKFNLISDEVVPSLIGKR
jgi:hypothetical protein